MQDSGNVFKPGYDTPQKTGPVVCLGMTFSNDEERREYFRNELRKKLPELKQIDGYPIGEDEDIIALSDPPYYTACPNPWFNDFIEEWEEQKKALESKGKRASDFTVNEPYASDVHEGKYDPIYLLHSYLTKVPPKAIMSFLEHYTQPGDIVLDGFAGTGMTGVAAKFCKSGSRQSICIDLSPLAAFISYFITSKESQISYQKEATKIINDFFNEFKWMYETNHRNGQKGIIDYVIWSNVYQCPTCGEELNFYDLAYDDKSGDVKDELICPKCSTNTSKHGSEKVFETLMLKPQNEVVRSTKRVPALIGYTYGGKKFKKKPDADDFALLKRIDDYDIPYWTPEYKIINGDEIKRAKQDGIEYFSQYYLRRTLISLCAIKDKIKEPLYNSLLTKVAFQLTIMYRFRKKGGSPLAGTMYVPALMKELNIFNQLSAFITARGNVSISDDSDVIIGTQSSTNLWAIKENSIDYIFTDPPFGSNLMYSELNFLSEMWLKVLTDNGKECIENDTQGKDVNIYKSIISEVFGQYYRVLKYNHWLSVEFSNTSAEVWQSIQSAIKNAGFLIASVSVLDKKTKTYKAITTRTAVNNDLVISCYKPTRRLEESFNNDKTDPQNIWMFVEEFLDHLPVHYRDEDKTTAIQERSPKILFDRLIAYYVQHGYPVPMSASEFQKGLKERFVERDGMYFTSSQALEYETKKKETTSFVGLALLVGSEAEGIEWLKNRLGKKPMTYQEIQPEWMRDLVDAKKGDTIPELMQILEENFIRDEDGRWHIPDINNQAELEAMRNKRLLKEFDGYVASKRIRDARLEALRAGFKNCYEKNDFATILAVADKIPESLLMEDEVLVMYYDIASARA